MFRLTRDKLERFVQLRRASKDRGRDGFIRDLALAGIRVSDLGPAFQVDGWFWQTPHGDLIEDCQGNVRLTGD